MKMEKRVLSILLTAVLLVSSFLFAELVTAEDGEFYQVGDVIEFGEYPQSLVTDEVLIAQLNLADKMWASYRYYSGSGTLLDGQMTEKDYMMYCDVEYGNSKYRGVVFDAYRPYCSCYYSSARVSYQDDNGYLVGTTYWFKYETIKWKVLDPSEGLVICVSIIDTQPFNDYILVSGTDAHGEKAYWGDSNRTYYASDYAKSSLRKWLNESFFSTAFNEVQKDRIAVNQNQNNDGYYTLTGNANYTDYDSNPTDDRVFLLSFADICNPDYGFLSYTSSDKARRAKGTDYAKIQGLFVNNTGSDLGYSFWWVRSPGSSSGHSFPVTYNGGSLVGAYVDETTIGIRPAICIDLEHFEGPEGPSTGEDPYTISISPTDDYKILNGNLYKKSFSLHTFSFYYEEVNAIDVYLDIKNNYSDFLAEGRLELYAKCESYAGVEWLRNDVLVDETIGTIPYRQTYSCRLQHISNEELISFANNRDIQLNYVVQLFNETVEPDTYLEQKETVPVNYGTDNAVFPDGYDFTWDSYSFENVDDTIDQSFYIDRYGKNIGKQLYKKHESGDNHGHCYGMAATTGLYLQNSPDKSGYIRLIEKTDLAALRTSFGWISALEYIKNAHIYQYSAEANNARKLNKGILSVKQAVEQCIQNNKPIMIEFLNKTGEDGHAVLAVGMDGNDILVNDSNDPNYLHRIAIDGTTWAYSCAGLCYDNDITDISWFEDYTNIYAILTGDGKYEYYKNRLVASSSGIIPDKNDDIINIYSVEGNISNDSSLCYWLKDTGTLNATNFSSDIGMITVVSNVQIINTILGPQGSVIINTYSEELTNIQITGQDSIDIQVDFTNENDDKTTTLHITGETIADNVLIRVNKDAAGIQGLNSMTVTYAENEEEKQVKTILNEDGREINMVIDEPNSAVVLQHAHNYTGKITAQATCTAAGTETYTCSICGDTYTKPINKVAHQTTLINVREATCDAEGYTGDDYCTTCKQIIHVGTTIPKLERPTDHGTQEQPQQSGSCKWCGKTHGNGFFQKFIAFFHNILATIFRK